MNIENLPKRRTAFTLVEMLLVIAIVAVMVAILLPAVTKAKSEAQRLMCMSTQRQLIILQTCYQTDNRGLYCHNALPGPGMITADTSGGTDKSSGWVNYMCDYKNEKKKTYFWWNGTLTSYNPQRVWSKYEGAWFCPTQAKIRDGGFNYLSANTDHFNFTTYDLNPTIFGVRVNMDPTTATGGATSPWWGDLLKNPDSWAGPSGNNRQFTLRTSRIGTDAKVVMIYDPSHVSQLDIWGWNSPLGQSNLPGTEMSMLSWQAHDGKANIGMADGHVVVTTSTLYNRIGTPKNFREFSYY